MLRWTELVPSEIVLTMIAVGEWCGGKTLAINQMLC